MIDFRYHLVSLASVLIALAVGIVLGAGPLKEGISESLNQQVTSLRTEKSALRAELDAAEGQVRTQESFADAQLSRMVAGRLTERAVTVIELPGAQESLVSATEDTLGAAGASLLGPIQISQSWSDPSQEASEARSRLASEVAASVGVSGDTPSLGDVLGALLVRHTPADGQVGSAEPGAAPRQAAWNRLTEAGLVSGTLPATRGSLVVLVGPNVEVTTETATSSSPTPYADQASLAAALDSAGDGLVIVAQVDPAASADESLIGAARGESRVRQRVSSVDNADSAIGQVSTVGALVEQAAGRSGQYGMAAGARSPFAAG